MHLSYNQEHSKKQPLINQWPYPHLDPQPVGGNQCLWIAPFYFFLQASTSPTHAPPMGRGSFFQGLGTKEQGKFRKGAFSGVQLLSSSSNRGAQQWLPKTLGGEIIDQRSIKETIREIKTVDFIWINWCRPKIMRFGESFIYHHIIEGVLTMIYSFNLPH